MTKTDHIKVIEDTVAAIKRNTELMMTGCTSRHNSTLHHIEKIEKALKELRKETNTGNEIDLSFCPYENGEWDLFITDNKKHIPITLSKHKDLSDQDKEVLFELMPPCVKNSYKEQAND